ncbi:ribosome releasing factor [Vibrio sp. 10N.286.55.E10]|uniref:Ribosome releasing factor n=1 Tax=Vibrio splendidus 12E03 TaxID=1191305 RepID=A0A1E5FDQ3_VIBSP|nr:ribosome releasing factor [Vibrio crassostreae 9CS106]NOH92273.1 ribosome releasing factor [Vibrio sp. AIC-3]OCH54412.1 ribosome releasing factor [Vibrio sp. ZF57]OED78030.1 ribosome releasing factor [Vibrio crassostreae ZF-91]OEE86900.1 ribosome releasing factor [Vibrio crassostreae 9ZC88]OEE92821.1 ribosome releasing factor [Vibrio crassostreae 9ZC77]OEE99697.1 ribosome releasing factor [Vibrio crassostreae 9ZC13]OEF87391.1 ribosome releasing factor [Vibrio splendidus 12E03]OMO33057.1 
MHKRVNQILIVEQSSIKKRCTVSTAFFRKEKNMEN